MGSVVTIVCSDVTRNGKTLLARLYADLYSMRKSNSPLIFDTDLSGNGITNYFGDQTRTVDLSRVADQVSLFDTMLEFAAKGNGPDFVVDVAANELNRFFRIYSDIGFERGAFEAQLEVQICHIISWTFRSLQTAANIRNMITRGRFIAVRNLAIEALPFTPNVQEEAQLPQMEIEMFLKALSPRVYRIVQEHSFSFARFATGEFDELDYEVKAEIWNFLEDVHNQIQMISTS